MGRGVPRWLRELAEECGLAAYVCEQGAGMAPVVDLEAKVREQAKRHSLPVGEVVRRLVELVPPAANPPGRA